MLSRCDFGRFRKKQIKGCLYMKTNGARFKKKHHQQKRGDNPVITDHQASWAILGGHLFKGVVSGKRDPNSMDAKSLWDLSKVTHANDYGEQDLLFAKFCDIILVVLCTEIRFGYFLGCSPAQ